jgi:hypothetical protein
MSVCELGINAPSARVQDGEAPCRKQAAADVRSDLRSDVRPDVRSDVRQF